VPNVLAAFWKAGFAALVVAALLLSGQAARAADEPTPEQIDAASTAADHHALAAEYDALAKEAERLAQVHQKRADHYAGRPAFKGRTASRSTETSAGHCAKLAKTYRDAAAQYAALAEEHRGIAADLE
jgi:outer membrane murein-binding lipoprotein Lpp